jgi:hypothetical protein
MYQNFADIINVLNFDEELLRLLYYVPADLAKGTPDPLDPSLPNVEDMDEEKQWEIRNERIMFVNKTDDLSPDKPICRLLVYAGRRTPANNDFLFAKQEVVIDIYCHNNFENGDLRSMRIADRLNKLFCQQPVTSMWKMDFVGGGQRNAPNQYVGYEVVYRFDTFKK